MLFNSFEFIFVFLPITLYIYFLLGSKNQKLSAGWLSAASLAFYGWWNPLYLSLLLLSIVFNYLIGFTLTKKLIHESYRKLFLVIGIVSNVGLLAYYKYFGFILTNLQSFISINTSANDVILPLGISFFTFTQIAFIVDVYKGQAKELNFIHYILFVTYFPHLIAGPVLHHKEMMPQFKKPEIYKFNYEYFSVGLTIFIIGLFKKVMLADEMIKYVKPVFDSANNGNIVSFKESWGAALSYTLQLYFDFSGYSDMAIGISRMFGIVLPLNFNSPYKSTNIIEFWRRWHMTLSRFLRDYLYIPLGGNRKGKFRRYINLLITMILGGLWHGAGWTFIVWGGLHGFYLMINHIWHNLRIKLGHDLNRKTVTGTILSGFVTFIAVVFAWVFFRANSLESGISICQSMLGLNGFAFTGHFQLSMIAKLLVIAWLLPNTQQVMSIYLNTSKEQSDIEISGGKWQKYLQWQPNLMWLLICFYLASESLLNGNKTSEFLYFQF